MLVCIRDRQNRVTYGIFCVLPIADIAEQQVHSCQIHGTILKDLAYFFSGAGGQSYAVYRQAQPEFYWLIGTNLLVLRA